MEAFRQFGLDTAFFSFYLEVAQEPVLCLLIYYFFWEYIPTDFVNEFCLRQLYLSLKKKKSKQVRFHPSHSSVQSFANVRNRAEPEDRGRLHVLDPNRNIY